MLTMLVVVMCYLVCWLPVTLATVIYTFRPQLTRIYEIYYLLALVSYVNMLLNPLIYSAHLDIVGRVWRAAGTRLRCCCHGDRQADVDAHIMITVAAQR